MIVCLVRRRRVTLCAENEADDEDRVVHSSCADLVRHRRPEDGPQRVEQADQPDHPTAAGTIAACCAVGEAVAVSPSSLAPNPSCSIGLAIEITPMPAVGFRHSTSQISQNCGAG